MLVATVRRAQQFHEKCEGHAIQMINSPIKDWRLNPHVTALFQSDLSLAI